MSLHLYPKSSDSLNPTNNNATTGDESSDSDSASSYAAVFKLREELKKERAELAKTKKEKKELSTQLLQVQDDCELIEQKYEGKMKALHKATSKINELETLCDKKEGEIAELKASLEAASGRGWRLNSRLESSEKECSRLNLEKSQLEEKIALLEREVRKLELNAPNNEQLLAELNQLRANNLDLKRELVAAREEEPPSLAGTPDEEESPERMIFDQFHFDQRTEGVNLHQELIMLGSPLTAIFSQSCQFPSSEDLLEGLVEEVPVMSATTQTEKEVPVMSATTQTEKIPVAESFTQMEGLLVRTISTQTRQTYATHVNQRGPSWAVRSSNASAETERVPPELLSIAAVQTNTSNLGNSSVTSNGTETALQRYCFPYQPRGIPSPNLSQPMFPPCSEANRVGSSSNYRVFWWIWVMALLCLIVAYIGNGGRVNFSPVVNSCRNGLKFHYKKGMPPH